MTVRKLALPLLALPLLLAACGDTGGGGDTGNLIPADPSYFDDQRFGCAPSSTRISCPPFSCEVDVNGVVSNCDDACNTTSPDLQYCTVFAFTGPAGLDLCVPSQCEVRTDGSTQCTDDCADDDVTCYVMDLFEAACG